MAFSPQQIAPIDFDLSAAVGVNIPLSGPAVFISNYQTKDAIKNNLINFFLTNPGERPLNPLFGGGLRAFIFEQITLENLSFLRENINNKLEIFFSNIIVNDLTVKGDPDNNQINVVLKYSVLNTNINDSLEISMDNETITL
jgi:phage baseplate assembly protein W